MRLLYYRHKAFPTQIFWKLLGILVSSLGYAVRDHIAYAT